MLLAVSPVTFEFKVVPSSQNPFAREIWAEVITPARETLRLPAFYEGKDQFAVHARADTKGEYLLGTITESVDGHTVTLSIKKSGAAKAKVSKIENLPAIRLDPRHSARFILSTGESFVPIGANLPWSHGSNRVGFYRSAFKSFAQSNLNWARVWMAHWGGLNMEWLPADMASVPPRGTLDLRVAKNWDQLIDAAEANGVYLQVVLQHHGQYSSKVDSNWRTNPWNAENPRGFLATPTDFFTSPEAIKLTRMKYRYIIARWGYSPAVMAWELFNEVHWTDAVRETHNEAAVAQWHSQMAAFIRSIDHYGHLVTASMDNLQSPVVAAMDYLQPHLYVPNILTGVRRQSSSTTTTLNRPVFYGEVGDDHLTLSPQIKATGIDIVPPVWASLTGEGQIPAQPWQGLQLLQTDRLGELGAVARFLAATKLGQRDDLTPFSARVECPEHVPLTLIGGQLWQKQPPQEITVPMDGRDSLDFSRIPRIYVGSKENLAEGYSGRTTFHFDFPKSSTLAFHITDSNTTAGTIRISIDGTMSVEKSWSAQEPKPDVKPKPYTDVIPVPITAGVHTVVVENPGSPGWFDLSQIDLGLDVPVLAATGQRGRDFLAVWVWHRNGIFSPQATPPAQGNLLIDDVPPGIWQVIWWDTLEGKASQPTTLSHPGGVMRIPTPPISRHAAVMLTRVAS
jgi:hypothetical protein